MTPEYEVLAKVAEVEQLLVESMTLQIELANKNKQLLVSLIRLSESISPHQAK